MVKAYSASDWNASKPVVATILVIRAKTPIGKNFMIPDVSRIIVWNSASNSSTIGLLVLSGNAVIEAPKTIQKKIIASMSASAAAWTKFSGTMSRISSTGELGVAISGSCYSPAGASVALLPGRIRLTKNRPVKAARRLDSA